MNSFRYKKTILLFLLLQVLSAEGQDLEYVRNVVEKLASPNMQGRGYVKNGDRRASAFISEEYQAMGLKHFGADYFQDFSLTINTFPGKIRLKVNDKPLVPGRDFTISCNSPGTKGTFPLIWPFTSTVDSSILFSPEQSENAQQSFIVLDDSLSRFKNMKSLPYKGLIILKDKKLWWHVSKGNTVNPWIALDIKQEVLPAGTPEIKLNYKNQFKTDFITRNVIGYIRGKTVPDTFLVFTAHYDHLGRMGKDTYFPGAHDNASGMAMMMDLARYYLRPDNQPVYSLVFIAFSGEEAGLLGSKFYALHPLFPLGSIRFLINLDMVSTGADGIMVVNGAVFEKEFEWLKSINEKENLVKEVKKRGPATNSDHYPFYEQGVPSFFIYTLGEYNEYHTVDDKPEMLPFTAYDSFFTLITRFIGHFE